eukprot:GHUV01023146.1.p1 GENE.GHUV01023146.1~~GHUV01023146.1.p1  ORF type:complete len:165 (+),score=22.74 GHUV01023146.1:225-719(+)
MGSSSTFTWPFFYQYPPYFTRQPVKETADKQTSLWASLILAYCKHRKLYVLSPSDDIPLWHNKDINRRLSFDTAVAFLDDLVASGSALWLDPPHKTRCLILWKRLPDVAAAISDWASTYGVSDSVMLVDDLASGAEVAGTELEGMHREVLIRALHMLEAQGKVR